MLPDLTRLSGQIYIAFSGGVDSSAALLLAKQQGLRPTAVHFNHGWEKSDTYEKFTVNVCQKLNVPILLGRSEAKCKGETDCRAQRFKFFSKLPDQSTLILGHNLEEQVETIILQLSRGSKNPAIKQHNLWKTDSKTIHLVRPFLATPKKELEEFCNNSQLAWIEDPTNKDQTIPRNLVRHSILPILEQLNSSALIHWGDYGKEISQENHLVEETILQQTVENLAQGEEIDCKVLDSLSNKSVKQVLHAWLSRQVKNLDKGHIATALQVARGARKGCPLPEGHNLVRSKNILTVKKMPKT